MKKLLNSQNIWVGARNAGDDQPRVHTIMRWQGTLALIESGHEGTQFNSWSLFWNTNTTQHARTHTHTHTHTNVLTSTDRLLRPVPCAFTGDGSSSRVTIIAGVSHMRTFSVRSRETWSGGKWQASWFWAGNAWLRDQIQTCSHLRVETNRCVSLHHTVWHPGYASTKNLLLVLHSKSVSVSVMSLSVRCNNIFNFGPSVWAMFYNLSPLLDFAWRFSPKKLTLCWTLQLFPSLAWAPWIEVLYSTP